MKIALVGAALVALTVGASAQDKRPEYGTAVNAAGAKKIAVGVVAECQKNGWNVAVAVVDNHGFLVYFERMDNTQTASWTSPSARREQRPPIAGRRVSLRM